MEAYFQSPRVLSLGDGTLVYNNNWTPAEIELWDDRQGTIKKLILASLDESFTANVLDKTTGTEYWQELTKFIKVLLTNH